MKLLIASDIHGSYKYTAKMIEIAKEEKVDKIILLGDILYHGPRNNLPKGFAPKKVVSILNENKNMIVGVKGNCDAEIDLEVLSFPISEQLDLYENDLKIHFEHGHKLKSKYDCNIVFYGHYHIHKFEKIDGICYVNPGSLGLPKENQDHSFAMLEGNTITIRNTKNKVLSTHLV
ncbi:MAG: phosphodiesterase [Bacilli bacterium]|nr:phosphodiesterase [Bacilli bacterium]